MRDNNKETAFRFYWNTLQTMMKNKSFATSYLILITMYIIMMIAYPQTIVWVFAWIIFWAIVGYFAYHRKFKHE